MSTRAINMEKRRRRILAEARRTIAERGFPSLNMRSLADAAGVTQPTLYNLIGNKEEILLMLISETMAALEPRREAFAEAEPVALLEAMADESTSLFSAEEDFYRAAFVANEFFSDQEKIWGKRGGLTRWAVALMTEACRTAQEQGQLRGSIPPDILGERIFASYRVASRDWAFRLISIEEFRETVLQASYIGLAADAEETFRPALIGKLTRLRKARSTKPARRKAQVRGLK
ncbi:MAG: TetR/AcrR family transcriptional regulator [bacterium]|nr:TetR/AcrR family transcriptional regulator [bacterium]